MNGKESYFLWNEWNAVDGPAAYNPLKERSKAGQGTQPSHNSTSFIHKFIFSIQFLSFQRINLFIKLNCWLWLEEKYNNIITVNKGFEPMNTVIITN